MKSDKVTMSSSLECRCPFLDIELAEFYFSQSGNEKYIIKRYFRPKSFTERIFKK